MIRLHFLGGFPWNPLGTSQYQFIPLIQIAAVTGVYGISFFVVWISLSFFSAIWMIFFAAPPRGLRGRRKLFCRWPSSWHCSPSVSRNERTKSSGATLRITLVQPSVPQNLIWDPNENDKRFQQLLLLVSISDSTQSNGITKPSPVPSDTLSPLRSGRGVENRPAHLAGIRRAGIRPENYIAITNLIRPHHIWLIFNAEDAVWRPDAKNRDDFDVYNAAFLFNPEGRFAGVYHKQKLVIFGEYIPLVRWLPFIKWFTPITGGFASGTGGAV